MFNQIKKIFSLQTQIEGVQEELRELKNKTFGEGVKLQRHGFVSFWSDCFQIGYQTTPISLEEKIDALAKHLNVSFVKTEKKDSEVKVKSNKKNK